VNRAAPTRCVSGNSATSPSLQGPRNFPLRNPWTIEDRPSSQHFRERSGVRRLKFAWKAGPGATAVGPVTGRCLPFAYPKAQEKMSRR
jgi:hypothetical protein